MRDAPVPEKVLPIVATEAVLAVLAGAVLADLAVSYGVILLGGALAPVAHVKADQPAPMACEWLGTPPLELSNTGGRQACRARLDALAIEQVPRRATLCNCSWDRWQGDGIK